MKIGQALRDLSEQPMQEQNLLSKGLSDIKNYFEERSIAKFMKKVDEIGPMALEGSKYANSKEVVLAVIENEAKFRDLYDAAMQCNQLTDQERLEEPVWQTYRAFPHKDRAPDSVMSYLESPLRDDKELVCHSIESLGFNELMGVPSEIRSDTKVFLTAFLRDDFDSSIYESPDYFDPNIERPFLSDREALLSVATIDRSFEILSYCTPELQDDKGFVLSVIRGTNDDRSIQAVSDRLKNDEDVVLVALTANNNPEQIMPYVSQRIQKLVGSNDPLEALTKAINSEKLASKLANQLKPKSEKIEKSLKI